MITKNILIWVFFTGCIPSMATFMGGIWNRDTNQKEKLTRGPKNSNSSNSQNNTKGTSCQNSDVILSISIMYPPVN